MLTKLFAYARGCSRTDTQFRNPGSRSCPGQNTVSGHHAVNRFVNVVILPHKRKLSEHIGDAV